jgi:hypothetical protein
VRPGIGRQGRDVSDRNGQLGDYRVRSLNLPHENFREGFIVGFQLIHGLKVTVPSAPVSGTPPAGMSPFLMGLKSGIRAAGGEIVGPDGRPI